MHPGCLDIWLIALRILPTMSMETMNIMTTIIMLLLLIIAMNYSQNIWCAPTIQIILHKKETIQKMTVICIPSVIINRCLIPP